MENKKAKIEISMTILGVIIMIIVCLSFFLLIQNYNIKQENNLFKTILYIDSKVYEVSSISQKGEYHYSEASFFYENKDYKNVESNCRFARGYYSEASQEYREINSELKNFGIKDPLIDFYSESLELLAEIKLNMFEACEHFESASRYYDKYYNTDVSYDDSSYEMGGSEIGMMNEKIRLHDENVRKYNDILGDLKIELEKRIN